MRDIEIEKIVLNCGGVGDKLEKSVKLLEMITKRKVKKLKSTRRIPAFAISPGKESGCKVTLRDTKQYSGVIYLLCNQRTTSLSFKFAAIWEASSED